MFATVRASTEHGAAAAAAQWMLRTQLTQQRGPSQVGSTVINYLTDLTCYRFIELNTMVRIDFTAHAFVGYPSVASL